MAELVVDGLEAVEVEDDERDAPLVGDRAGELGVERAPVGEAGERVALGHHALARLGVQQPVLEQVDGDVHRIGGDEFAVVAPGAGVSGVARLVGALEAAIAAAEFPPEVSGLAASFASAVAPLDALTAPDLFDCADKRLLSRKRVGRQPS